MRPRKRLGPYVDLERQQVAFKKRKHKKDGELEVRLRRMKAPWPFPFVDPQFSVATVELRVLVRVLTYSLRMHAYMLYLLLATFAMRPSDRRTRCHL